MPANPTRFKRSLFAAIEELDRAKVAERCEELVEYLRVHGGANPYDPTSAKDILGQLRRKRYFDLMERVAAAFLSVEKLAVPKVRILYAQALLDGNKLVEGIAVLTGITEGDAGDPEEAIGLLGRAYKQLYINKHYQRARTGDKVVPPFATAALQRAINAYLSIYKRDRAEHFWHGINVVALLKRAERDWTWAKADVDADAEARSILKVIENCEFARKAEMWHFATAMEACVALGDQDEAVKWAEKYIGDRNADAFELGSTLRQLQEVWSLDATSELGSSLIPKIRDALLRQEGGQIDLTAGDVVTAVDPDQPGTHKSLERQFGVEGAVSISWVMRGISRSKAVARIDDEYEPCGTGFLVRGGDLHEPWGDRPLLVTNAHVISNRVEDRKALRSEEARVCFTSAEGERRYRIEEVLWTSPTADLDCTIASLQGQLPSVSPLPLGTGLPQTSDPRPQKRIYVIGHPQGSNLHISLYDNLLVGYDGPHIHYRSPTKGGSSGSPVFDCKWRLIALHHAADSSRSANEGVLFEKIKERLAAEL